MQTIYVHTFWLDRPARWWLSILGGGFGQLASLLIVSQLPDLCGDRSHSLMYADALGHQIIIQFLELKRSIDHRER